MLCDATSVKLDHLPVDASSKLNFDGPSWRTQRAKNCSFSLFFLMKKCHKELKYSRYHYLRDKYDVGLVSRIVEIPAEAWKKNNFDRPFDMLDASVDKLCIFVDTDKL